MRKRDNLNHSKSHDEPECIASKDFLQLLTHADKNAHPFVLDVRTKDELKQGFVENCMHVPFMELLTTLKTAPLTLKVPRDKTVYVLCYDGNRSRLASSLLKQKRPDLWHVCYILEGARGLNQYEKQIKQEVLKQVSFFEEEELKNIYFPEHQYMDSILQQLQQSFDEEKINFTVTSMLE